MVATDQRQVRSEYLGAYNELLSEVAAEFGDRFAATASPTLSKQETVTFLYQTIEQVERTGRQPSFPWVRMIQFVPRLAWMLVRVIYIAARFRVRTLPEAAIYFRTSLVPRSVAGPAVVDDYFRELPGDLMPAADVVVGFTSVDVSLSRRFEWVPKPANYILAYGLLTLFDVLRLFADYSVTGLLRARKRYVLANRDVTACINRSLLLDYLELRSLEAYAEKYKCRRLIRHRIRAFVYVFENQSWEKVCCQMLRAHGVRLIAYQSSGYSRVFLNFFPTRADAGRHPMPDILLTVGELFGRHLQELGHYRIPVKAFGALRFRYAHDGRAYLISPPLSRIAGRILYAFPVHLHQYGPTIRDLIEVFEGSTVSVDLKFHPLYSEADVKEVPKLPSNFRVINDVDMRGLRESYDCVLFNDNSFGLEAIVNGVKSFQYNRDGDEADDRFLYFDLWRARCSFLDLRALRHQLEARTYDKCFDVDSVAAYVRRLYKPYTSESANEFRELLAASGPAVSARRGRS